MKRVISKQLAEALEYAYKKGYEDGIYYCNSQDNETRHVLDQIVIEDGIKETRKQFKLV